MKLKGYFLAMVSAISYGLIPLFILPIKQINFPLDTTLFYRFLISAMFLLGIILYNKESLKINRYELFIFSLLGLFYGFSADLLFLGYDQLTPGIASTILFVYPVIVALIMVFFFKEKIKTLTLFALVITLSGILILSAKDSLTDIRFFGLFVTIGAALFYALYIITVNKAKIKASGWKITFYSMVFTSLYYLVKTQIFDESLVIPNVNTFLSFVVFALVTTVISNTALIYAIKEIGSTPTSIMGAMEPVVAVLVSVILFHELMTRNLVLGVVLILVGVIINILADAKKSKSNP